MKPAPFTYISPGSLQEVLEVLHQYGSDARLLAGGQSLIAAMNFRSLKPAVLVDLNRLPELAYIRHEAGDDVRIGAMTRQRTLELDPIIERALPLMYEAVPYIAHVAIRTRGTIGGSLAYADPAADQPTITMALNARLKVVSQAGERWIPIDDFFTDAFQTALKSDEMLTEIAIPPTLPGTGWGFEEIARRHGDRVMMGVSVMVTLDENNICREARLAYQNAAPTPRLAKNAARLLMGQSASPELFAEAATLASQKEIDPPTDVHATADYRRNLARELTLRTLKAAFVRARRTGG
jgi:carbon-monoxide dehydrogenase medium subunit